VRFVPSGLFVGFTGDFQPARSDMVHVFGIVHGSTPFDYQQQIVSHYFNKIILMDTQQKS